MSLSALSTALFVAGTLATLLAGALWVRAWRGRATGWGSCCRRCGFQLRGLNPSSMACPECGLDLRSAAALRPVARQNDPTRWGQAVIATCLGLVLLWLGQGPPLYRAGRQICARLPNEWLIDALSVMPTVAAAEIDARLQRRDFSPRQFAALAHEAALVAAANPADHAGPGWRVLHALGDRWVDDRAALTDALGVTLAGVTPVAGTPRACRPGGAFIVTATLPPTQAATWITRNELRLTIVSAAVRGEGGVMQPLEPVSAESRGSKREFDGTAFRAPAAAGTWSGEIRVRLQQSGGGFEAEAGAPFELRVLDPSMVHVTFGADARVAELLKAWLAQATSAADANDTGLLVSLPNDLVALQSQPLAIAGALKVVQGEATLDVGRVWIDEALPTISLFAAPMPASLDRERPATLRFVPDPTFAAGVASSSCHALGDTVEVPISLPPPPPAPPAASSPAP